MDRVVVGSRLFVMDHYDRQGNSDCTCLFLSFGYLHRRRVDKGKWTNTASDGGDQPLRDIGARRGGSNGLAAVEPSGGLPG
ncbi:hypothetical protein D3C81_2000720 [compost metagenome]